MPRITGLVPAKRRPGWYELDLDGAFCCRLPQDVVSEGGLCLGLELDEDAVTRLRNIVRREKAIQDALRYLSYRPRSCREVARRLRRRGHDEASVAEAISRCLELGYLGDERFAEAYARDRIRLKPRSVALMVAELRGRGVSVEVARAGVARSLAEEGLTEAELLQRAAAQGRTRFASREERAAARALAGYLRRRGFRASQVREALRSLPWEASVPRGTKRRT
ncbi:MAG: regulatory protein RecX [Gemmatimonadota bacterium]